MLLHENKDTTLDEIEFTIFDTETTGLDPDSGDRIVEIAGIRIKGNRKISEFQTLLNPERIISPAAFSVNKITQDEISLAPKIKDVLPDFISFFQGSCLCSYNAAFDMKFLARESKLVNIQLPADMVVVDILTIARRLLPKLERYALWFVAERLGIFSEQKHRALADVELTWQVFNRLKVIISSKDIDKFSHFLNLFGFTPEF